jgi:hypothetical protein
MAEQLELQVFAKELASKSDAARLQFAQLLKKAGLYKGNPSAKIDMKYYEALVKLEEKFQQQKALNNLLQDSTPIGRQDVLIQLVTDGGDGGDGDGDGPRTTSQTYITSKTQTDKILDAIATDLLDRKMTKAEKAKYRDFINAAQKSQPAVQTSGKGYSTTRGGVDEEQLVRDRLAQTGEAKTKRATDAYTIMLEELGGLR